MSKLWLQEGNRQVKEVAWSLGSLQAGQKGLVYTAAQTGATLAARGQS
jgi:hypothetical protein